MKNILLSIVFSLFCFTTINAQQTHEIKVLAKNKNGNIWLRWAPDNPVVWRLGNKYGYHIDRFDLLEDGKLIEDVANKGVRLTSNPIKPFSLSQLEELSNTDERAVVLIETIHNQASGTEVISPADIIKQKNELENNFGFALFICDLSTQMAEAAGLFFEDKNVKPNRRYTYRISIANAPDNIDVKPAVKTIDSKNEEPLTAIEDLEANFADKKVTLAWSEMKYYGIYSAYFIQKSTDGKVFKNISELPYMHIAGDTDLDYQYFVDSLPDNDTEFHYRIMGITPFGEMGEPSNVVHGSGIDLLLGAVYIDTVYLVQDNNRIQFTLDPALADQISNIYVAKANSANGPFIPIHKKPLKSKENQIIDENTTYNQYYVVQYQNAENNKPYQSLPYLAQKPDDVPPRVPAMITGRVDSTGNVNLTWQVNTDADLLGYRVFSAHSMHDEFIEVSNEIVDKPFFNEQINITNLSRSIYYKVIAVDKRFNTSDYSPAFKLAKPDVLPPAAPVFTQEQIKDGAIFLHWINSVSADVAGYRLLREDLSSDSIAPISSWSQIDLDSISDHNNLELGHTYRYHLIATDSSENETVAYSRPIYYETGLRPGAKMVISKVDKQNKQITISWQKESGCKGFHVYRTSGENSWTLYYTAKENVNEYLDDNLQESTIYKYKIKLIYADGKSSPLSDAIVVKF